MSYKRSIVFTNHRELDMIFRASIGNIGAPMSDIEKNKLENEALGNLHRARKQLSLEKMKASKLAVEFGGLAKLLEDKPEYISIASYEAAPWFNSQYLASVVSAIENARRKVEEAESEAAKLDLDPYGEVTV
jgi:predicted Zn-dependent protease